MLLDPALPKAAGRDGVLRRLRAIASDEFGISHITFQVEQSIDGCTEDHHVGHLEAAAAHEPTEIIAASRLSCYRSARSK